jgi:hypothetical protein
MIAFQADDNFLFYLNGHLVVANYVPNGSSAEANPVTATIPVSDFTAPGQANYFAVENQNSTCCYVGSAWLITVQCADGDTSYITDADTTFMMYDDQTGDTPPASMNGYQWYQPGYSNPSLFNGTPVKTYQFWFTGITNPLTGQPLPILSHSLSGGESGSSTGAGDSEALYYVESVILQQYSPTATMTPTFTPTFTRTVTATDTDTRTATPTFTPTCTQTATASDTPTGTKTVTPTDTPTYTQTVTATDTDTRTVTPTDTPTCTQTVTYTESVTRTDTPTDTPTYTQTATSTDTDTRTITPTDTPTCTQTVTSTNTDTRTVTSTDTPTCTQTVTSTDTSTSTATLTGTSTSTQTLSPTSTDTRTLTSTDTATCTRTVTSTDTITCTKTSTDTPSDTITYTETSTATDTPTRTATPTASATKTPVPPGIYSLDIKVYNSAGEVVAVLATNLSVPSYPSGVATQAGGAFIPDLGQVGTLTLQGISMTLAWDGTNSSGQFVSSGAYTITVLITDQYGRATTLSAVEQVLRQPVGYLVQIYNNAGELVREWDLRDGNWRLALQGNGTVDQGGIALMALPNGAELIWDGTSALGQPVSQGVYILKVERDDGSGQTLSTRQIMLLRRGALLAHKPYAAPNPVPAGASAVVIFLGGLNPEGSVRAGLYSLSGGLVANAALLSAGSELRLPLGHAAAGIYIASVEWVSSNAVLERHLVKVAVLR